MAGATFGGNGLINDKIDETSYTMRISEKTYLRLLQTGFLFAIDFPIGKETPNETAGRLKAAQHLRREELGNNAAAGEYVLQIIVKDLLANAEAAHRHAVDRFRDRQLLGPHRTRLQWLLTRR